MHPTRRQLLGALAAAATVTWTGAEARAAVSAERVRPGAALTLACPGADGFLVAGPDGTALHVPAPGGRARFPAPAFPADGDWCTLTCTPVRRGSRAGAPATVEVLAAPVFFGA